MKAKTKKPCEFEAMRVITELLEPFSQAELVRIFEGVKSKLESKPVPKPRGRKPKATVQVPT